MKIKAVVFDLGGVVLIHKIRDVILNSLHVLFKSDLEDIKSFYETLEDDWVTGKIKDRDVIARFKKKFSSKQTAPELIDSWETLYKKDSAVNIEVLKTADELRAQGYKVYVLSDTVDIHHRLNLKRDIFNHFDEVFASFIEGKSKRSGDFFEHFLKQTGLKPNECIFIDDRKGNVKLARELGIYSILFKNYLDLNKKLKPFLL